MTSSSNHPRPAASSPQSPSPGERGPAVAPKRLSPLLAVVFAVVSLVVVVAVIGGVALMTAQRIDEARSEGQGDLFQPQPLDPQALRGPKPDALRLPEEAELVPPYVGGMATRSKEIIFAEVPATWQATSDFIRLHAVKDGWRVTGQAPARNGRRGITLSVVKSGWARMITILERPGEDACTVAIAEVDR